MRLTARQRVIVGRAYAKRYVPDPSLSRAEYLARLNTIARELYPDAQEV